MLGMHLHIKVYCILDSNVSGMPITGFLSNLYNFARTLFVRISTL